MKLRPSFPLFALFGMTRGMAGIGIGMLLADRLSKKRRKTLGKVLLGVGVASTIPLIAAIVRRSRRQEVGGVEVPMTTVYTPTMGVVDDSGIESPQQGEMPKMWP